jgi:hypothetical protein
LCKCDTVDLERDWCIANGAFPVSQVSETIETECVPAIEGHWFALMMIHESVADRTMEGFFLHIRPAHDLLHCTSYGTFDWSSYSLKKFIFRHSNCGTVWYTRERNLYEILVQTTLFIFFSNLWFDYAKSKHSFTISLDFLA